MLAVFAGNWWGGFLGFITGNKEENNDE